jgi:CRP-like cAMP-binding protein
MRRSPRDPLARRLRALGLPEPTARRLAQAGTPIDLPAGAALCTEGERGTEAFVLVDGHARVELPDGDVVVGPGDVIGELATIDPFARRNATVRTTEPSLVLVYDVQTFRSLATLPQLRPVLVPDRTRTAA